MTKIYQPGMTSLWANPAANVKRIGSALGGQMGATSGQPGMPMAQGLGMQGIGGNGPSGTNPWPVQVSGGGVPLGGFNPSNSPALVNFGNAPTIAPQTGVSVSHQDIGGLRGGTVVPQTGTTGTGGTMPPPNAVYNPGATTFSPGSNLIGTQISPTNSQRLTNFQNTADSAVNTYAGLGSQQNIDALRSGMQTGLTSAQGAKAFQYSPLSIGAGIGIPEAPTGGGAASKTQQMLLDDLAKIREGTDRGKIATESYDLLAERGRPEFDQRVRQLGQNTAALGRIGSGIYGSNLTDLNAERERELGLGRRELANTAAGDSLSDRLNILNATQGVSKQLGDAEATRYGSYVSGLGDAYNRARDERDFGFNVARYNNDLAFRRGGVEQDTAQGIFGAEGQFDDRRFGQARNRAGDLAGYADSIAGREQSDRNEQRGERDYQYGLSRDAENDRYRQRGFEEDLIDRAYDRDIRGRTVEDALYGNQVDRSQRAYETGRRNNVAGQLNSQAQRYDQQSADAGDAFAEMMKSYGMRQTAPQVPTDDFYRRVNRQTANVGDLIASRGY